jgi:hypothetical protein
VLAGGDGEVDKCRGARAKLLAGLKKAGTGDAPVGRKQTVSRSLRPLFMMASGSRMGSYSLWLRGARVPVVVVA